MKEKQTDLRGGRQNSGEVRQSAQQCNDVDHSNYKIVKFEFQIFN